MEARTSSETVERCLTAEGLVISLSKSIEAKSRPVQIVASLFDLYLAAMCLAVATAVFDFVWGPRHVPFPAVLMQHILGVLWGLTFTGYFLVLWPLSFFNHRLVWRADAAGGVAAPKVGPFGTATSASVPNRLPTTFERLWRT